MSDLSHIKETLVKNNTIDPQYYKEIDVKRGLRNQDGSGVLAGLSNISSVIGARTEDYQRVPVDGELSYRGHSLFELADTFKLEDGNMFEKVSYLLLVGDIASPKEEAAFIDLVQKERELPQELIDHVVNGLPSKHIMNKLQTAVSALYGFDDDADSLDPYENFRKAVGLMAKMPIIAAYSYLAAYKDNPTLVSPKAGMSTAEAFLYVLNEGETPDPFEVQIVDLCLAIHAEHGGGNNSTFTTYVVSSSGSDIYCSIAAAIASLKGPLHGSANKMVMEMMADINDHVSDWSNESQIKAYLQQILEKKAHDKSGKIYGLGHAVYTKSDPRAVLLKTQANKLAEMKQRKDELDLYLNIEKVGPALFAEMKGDKKVISPNVDFFSGFVYDCMGIPEELYTPMFAMARVVGWCAHRIEETLSGKRIIRPGYKFVKKR